MKMKAEVKSMIPEQASEKQKSKIKSAIKRFTQRVQEIGVSQRVAAIAVDTDNENSNDAANHAAVEATIKDVAFNDEDFSLKKPSFNLKEIMARALLNKVQDLKKTGAEAAENFAAHDPQSASFTSPRNYDSSHLSLFSQEEKKE